MIIKPIDELVAVSESIIDANKKRIEKIKAISNKEKEMLFQEFEINVEEKAFTSIKMLLENRMFFEIIEEEMIENLVKVYHSNNIHRKIEYINCLKESYKIRGIKGAMFTFGGIIKRFSMLSKNIDKLKYN